jgi:probable rRNA maturation factor
VNVEVSGAAVPRLSRREIAAFVRKVLRAAGRHAGEVSIALVDDQTMRSLNHRFRGKNKTTDVLTFPADVSYAGPGAKHRPLGDIVISVDQARRQAAEEQHSLPTEIRYLILHGILHALGYDHETDGGEMDALEVSLREKVGLG